MYQQKFMQTVSCVASLCLVLGGLMLVPSVAVSAAAPILSNDNVTTIENTAVNINVLQNDLDPDGGSLQVKPTLVSQPAHGTAVVMGSYAAPTQYYYVRYTPNVGYVGTDSFSYNAANDTTNSTSPATVSINITAAIAGNTPPVGAADVFVSFHTNMIDDYIFLNNDIDADGDTLKVNRIISQPAHGRVDIYTNMIVYTKTDYTFLSGADPFTYEVSDGRGGVSSPIVAYYTMPVATSGCAMGSPCWPEVNNDYRVMYQDQVSININVEYNDSIINTMGGTETLTLITNPNHGTANINGKYIRYTPSTAFTGNDSFVYRVTNDSNNMDEATVYITVLPSPSQAVNHAPLAVADNLTVAFDVTSNLKILSNDSDSDGDTLSITQVATQPAHGTAEINADNLTIDYTPTTGYMGSDSFTYTITDGLGNYSTATVTLNVTLPFSNWTTDSQGVTTRPYQLSAHNGKFYQSYIGANNRIYTRSTDSTDVFQTAASGWSTWETSADPYEKTFLPVTMASFSIDGKLYHTHIGSPDSSSRQKIYTRSSTDGLTWSNWTKGNDPYENTALPIGMIEFNDKLYQVHVGGPDSTGRQKIYTRSSTDGVTWSNWTKGNDPYEDTKLPVKIAAFEGKLYQVHVGTDKKIYTRSSTDGVTWSNWTKGNDPYESTSSTVEIQAAAGKLYEVHKGNDNSIYTRVSSDGITWSVWVNKGGSTTLPISMTEFDGHLYQGMVGTDNKMYWRRAE